MSDTEHPADSIAALSLQRVAKPGLLDHAAIQARHQRLQHAALGHALTQQLHGRVQAAQASQTGELSLAGRAEGAPTHGEAAPSAAVPIATAPAHTGISVQRAALPATQPPAITQRLLARGTFGLLDSGASIANHEPSARSTSDALGFAAQVQARYGADSAEPAAPRITAANSPVLVQRVAAKSTALPATHWPAASATPSAAMAQLPVAAGRVMPRAAMPPASTAASVTDPATASMPARTLLPTSAPLISRAVSTPAAQAPLVLQRMALPARAIASLPVPYPMPTTTIIPRSMSVAPSHATTPTATHAAPDIDTMVEEVARRLMRRLEIERERKGLRQWR